MELVKFILWTTQYSLYFGWSSLFNNYNTKIIYIVTYIYNFEPREIRAPGSWNLSSILSIPASIIGCTIIHVYSKGVT